MSYFNEMIFSLPPSVEEHSYIVGMNRQCIGRL
ncbi:hypothetical protein LV59_03911 [Klebsiella pneumoniae]|nr:hypothetical protein LV59_03911 [Klebsiella pneumoniae]